MSKVLKFDMVNVMVYERSDQNVDTVGYDGIWWDMVGYDR